MALSTVQSTSTGPTSIPILPSAPQLTANSVAVAHPTDQGPQPYVGTWTNRSGAITNAGIVAPIIVAAAGGAAGHSYVPGNTITLADGAPSTHGVLTVVSTLVVSATIAAGGSGGTNGTQTVTGTTGTGTKFTASVTIAGNTITAVLSILTGGAYTANPTTITAEPVTGASLAGATLNLNMGLLSASLTTAGIVTAVPANPVAQTSSTGAGTGATFTLTYQGLSQTLAASNASRKCILIENPASSLGQNIGAIESLFINFTSAAGVNDGVSFEVTPGGYLPTPVTSTELVTVNAQTLGHRYIAREM
jgi:hypothetical protein